MGSAGPRGDLGVPARYEQRVVEAAAERGGGGSGGGATDHSWRFFFFSPHFVAFKPQTKRLPAQNYLI